MVETHGANDEGVYGKGDYLIQFAFCHQDFLLQELDSILDMYGIDPDTVYDKTKYDVHISPFLRVNLSEENILKVASRAVLVKAVYEIWGAGLDIEETIESVKKYPMEKKLPYFGEDQPWRIQVDGFGKRCKLEAQEQRRALFKFLDFKGPVQLIKKEKATTFWLIEDYGHDGAAKNLTKPKRLYFVREMAKGRRDLTNKYNLKKRTFIGPTSMDNELSFVMANQIQARKGTVVLDPFVGTGSLLVPCTVFGAHCFGLDIDIRILKGKEGKTVFSNFDQYELPHPDLMRMDFSPHGRSMRGFGEGFVDAIISDPPYGVRAGARKAGSRRATIRKVQKKFLSDHIPQTQPYEAVDVMHDLLDSAARILVLGGRLTYLLPVVIAEYTDAQLPRHPCLEVIANSEQKLTRKLARRLITMKKIKPYDEELVKAAKEQMDDQVKQSLSFSNIKEKLKKKNDPEYQREKETKRAKVSTSPSPNKE